jgi:hypothetical protein
VNGRSHSRLWLCQITLTQHFSCDSNHHTWQISWLCSHTAGYPCLTIHTLSGFQYQPQKEASTTLSLFKHFSFFIFFLIYYIFTVVHACNPSYSGGKDQKITVWSQPRANIWETLSQKKPSQKRGASSCKSTCLASMRLWVQTPVLLKKERKKL